MPNATLANPLVLSAGLLRRSKNIGTFLLCLETIQLCIDQICEGCDCWPREWQNEAEWRSSHGQHPPSWRFDTTELEKLHRWRWSANKCPNPKGFPEGLSHSGAIYCGHNVLCVLVNTFIPEVQYAGVAAYEAPAWDSRLFGMRPVSAWPRLGTNDRTLHRMQAKPQRSGQ